LISYLADEVDLILALCGEWSVEAFVRFQGLENDVRESRGLESFGFNNVCETRSELID
jgi:hypothetical protein